MTSKRHKTVCVHATLAWAFILFSQIAIISSQSGRRSDQYNIVEEKYSNTNKSRTNKEHIKGIASFSSIHRPFQSLTGSNEIGPSKNRSLSGDQKKQKSIKSINLAKIKTLLPYVILKRAYSKIKQKQGKYNKKKNTEGKNKKALNEKSRHQSSSHEKLIDSLCKQSTGTSICKLLFSHQHPRHSKKEDISMVLKEPSISGKRKKNINHMQDEKGTLKYEKKDYHQGTSATTTSSSASFKKKSANPNHSLRVFYSSGSKNNPLIEESSKRSTFQRFSNITSKNQYFIRGVYKKQQNANNTENKDKRADNHKNHQKIPATNNDKSYPDDTFFTKDMVVKGTSKNIVPTKNLKGYEVRNNGTSFTPMLNNMYTTLLGDTSNKIYNKSKGDKNNKTHSSFDLLPHPKKSSRNELETSDVVKNAEKWWHTKVGREKMRQPKQQNISFMDDIDIENNVSDAKNLSFESNYNNEDELLPVSSSKLHMVRVLPPQDFIDKLKDKQRENSRLTSMKEVDDEKMDKKALDLMKLFMDHTDDFELDEEEITDLKEKAKDIEGQVYKRNLNKNGNQLERRKPRLSQIILNKIKEAEEISKLKIANKQNELQNYLKQSYSMEKDAYEKEDTKAYNQIEERSGSFQIMNSSEQTLQPRFSSLMFGQEKQKSFPRKHSLNFKEKSFSPSARSLDAGFSSIFSGPPHPPRHFSKFQKNHNAGPPILTSIPPTSFSCVDESNSEVKRTAGYYADPETNCQVYHYCHLDGRHDSFLCPAHTSFNQKVFVCDWWYNVNCDVSIHFYALNKNLYTTKYSPSSHNIAKGLGNDGLLSDLTRLLGNEDGGYEGNFQGRGFPSYAPKANLFKPKPIHSIDNHYHHKQQQYHKPYTEDSALYTNSIKPSILEAHPNPSLPHKAAKNFGDFIGNSIGGAFYDAKHDLVVSYKTKPEGGLAVFFNSPKSTDKTVITDAQRIKGLIEKSKESFFTSQNTKPPLINSGKPIGIGDNLLNYDDDYYSDEEPAELDANFVGKDYNDEDEFYDYEEYDSIVNGKRRVFENPLSKKEVNRKPELSSDNDYDYEYYEDDNGLSISKAYNLHSRSSKVEPGTEQSFVKWPQQAPIQRRHSFSSIDHDNGEYEDRTHHYFEQEDFENDVYEKEETNGHYAKTNSELDSTGNYHITYDGKYKYHPNKETKGFIPNYQQFIPSEKDPLPSKEHSHHSMVPIKTDFSQQEYPMYNDVDESYVNEFDGHSITSNHGFQNSLMSDEYRQDVFDDMNVNNRPQFQNDASSMAHYGTSQSLSPFEKESSSISFSNSLLDPKEFMKRMQINENVEPSIKPMPPSDPHKSDFSSISFSTISNLGKNVPDHHTSAKKPSLYSYFESKKTFDREKGNRVKSISKGDQSRGLIKTHKVSIPSSIPNAWSDLVFGRFPNTAKKFLNLEKRKHSELSSFRKNPSTRNVDDFSTKKLRWLLNRTKRDVNEKHAGISESKELDEFQRMEIKSLPQVKKNATSLNRNISNSSSLHFHKVHKESIKSKTHSLKENKQRWGKKIDEHDFPYEKSILYLKDVGYNSENPNPMPLPKDKRKNFIKNLDSTTTAYHLLFQERQKDESNITSRKVFTAIQLLDILLTLILYLDNHRHKNDIQDKKNIFVESTTSIKELTKRVGTGDSEKTFLASQQKTSLEHYKDYLFASHHHNYNQKRGFDFSTIKTHNNAFQHPYFVVQKKIENKENWLKNRYFEQENKENLSKNVQEKDAKLGSTNHPSLATSSSFNSNKVKTLPLETLDDLGLNKNHSILDNDAINGIKPYLAITNPSKNLTKSKSNTITRLDNPSHNISSSIDGKNVLLEGKLDSNVNKTLNVSDSLTRQDKNHFFSTTESEKYKSNLAEISDNASKSLKDKFKYNDSLDANIGALDFGSDAITVLNTANFVSSTNYPEKDAYHPTTFNQINESLHQPNVVAAGKIISFVSSNTTSSPKNVSSAAVAATSTQPKQLFNNNYLNSKTEISSTAEEKLTTRTSLQPPIFHPKNFSYSPLNVKKEHFVVIPSPQLAISQPTYHKNNDTLRNGKDQKQRETNDSHYHKILAKKSKGAGGTNFWKEGLASSKRVKYSPFLTPSLPQIIPTIRKWLGNNLTGNNDTNFRNEDIARFTEKQDFKQRENKRNVVYENISEDGFEKDHKSSERDLKKNMSDDVGYGLYDDHERKSKNGFEGSGLWPENNRSGGIIITLLEKAVRDISEEKGSKSQSNFDVRSLPSTNSSYTTLINYLIHLVETLLPLRDNIDRIEEVAIEQNEFSLDEKSNNNDDTRTISNGTSLDDNINYQSSTYEDFGDRATHFPKYEEETLANDVTAFFDDKHPQNNNNINRTVIVSNEKLLKNTEEFYGIYSPTKRLSKNRDGNRTNNNTEVMNEKSNVLKQSLGNLQNSSTFPDDLEDSGSSVAISIQPYFDEGLKTLVSTIATATEERKRKQKQRKGKKQTHEENSSRKPNYSKTSTEQNNLSFSDLLSSSAKASLASPSSNRRMLASSRPIKMINSPFKKIYLSENPKYVQDSDYKTNSIYLADKAKEIRGNEIQFHKRLQDKLKQYEKVKETSRESLSIPPRLRNLLERLRVSLIAEKIRYLRGRQESIFEVDDDLPNTKSIQSKLEELAFRIAEIKQNNILIMEEQLRGNKLNSHDVETEYPENNSDLLVPISPDNLINDDTYLTSRLRSWNKIKENLEKSNITNSDEYTSEKNVEDTKVMFDSYPISSSNHSSIENFGDGHRNVKKANQESNYQQKYQHEIKGLKSIRFDEPWESTKLRSHSLDRMKKKAMENSSDPILNSVSLNFSSNEIDKSIHEAWSWKNESKNNGDKRNRLDDTKRLKETSRNQNEKNITDKKDNINNLNESLDIFVKDLDPPTLIEDTVTIRNSNDDQILNDNEDFVSPYLYNDNIYIDEYDTNLSDILTDDYVVYENDITTSYGNEPNIELDSSMSDNPFINKDDDVPSLAQNVKYSNDEVSTDKKMHNSSFTFRDENNYTKDQNANREENEARRGSEVTNESKYKKKANNDPHHNFSEDSAPFSKNLTQSAINYYSPHVIKSTTSSLLPKQSESLRSLPKKTSFHFAETFSKTIGERGNEENRNSIGVKTYNVIENDTNDSSSIHVPPQRILEVNLKIPFDLLYEERGILPPPIPLSNSILFDAKYKADSANISSHENNMTDVEMAIKNSNSSRSVLGKTTKINFDSNMEIPTTTSALPNGLNTHEWKETFSAFPVGALQNDGSTMNIDENVESKLNATNLDESIVPFKSILSLNKWNKNILPPDEISSLPLAPHSGIKNTMPHYLSQDGYGRELKKDSLSFSTRHYPPKAYSEFSKFDSQSPSYGIYVTPIPHLYNPPEKDIELLNTAMGFEKDIKELNSILSLEKRIKPTTQPNGWFLRANNPNLRSPVTPTRYYSDFDQNPGSAKIPFLSSTTASTDIYKDSIGVENKNSKPFQTQFHKPYVLVAKKSYNGAVEYHGQDLSIAQETKLSPIIYIPKQMNVEEIKNKTKDAFFTKRRLNVDKENTMNNEDNEPSDLTNAKDKMITNENINENGKLLISMSFHGSTENYTENAQIQHVQNHVLHSRNKTNDIEIRSSFNTNNVTSEFIRDEKLTSVTNISNMNELKNKSVLNEASDNQNNSSNITKNKAIATKGENNETFVPIIWINSTVINSTFPSSSKKANEDNWLDASKSSNDNGPTITSTETTLSSTELDNKPSILTESFFPTSVGQVNNSQPENSLLEYSWKTKKIEEIPSKSHNKKVNQVDKFNGWVPLVVNPETYSHQTLNNHNRHWFIKQNDVLNTVQTNANIHERIDRNSNDVSSFSAAFLTKSQQKDDSLPKLKYGSKEFSSPSTSESIWNNFEFIGMKKKRMSRKVMNHDQNDNQIARNELQEIKQSGWSPVEQKNLHLPQLSMHQTYQDSLNASPLIHRADSSSSINAHFGASEKQIILPISSMFEFTELRPKLEYQNSRIDQPNYSFDNRRNVVSALEEGQESQWKKSHPPNVGRVQIRTVDFEPSIEGNRGFISEVNPPDLDIEKIRSWKPLYF